MTATNVPEKKAQLGEKMARLLKLHSTKQLDNSQPRYQLGKEFNTKGPVGVYETIVRIAQEAQAELAEFEAQRCR